MNKIFCTKCKESKLVKDFYLKSDGTLRRPCKSCVYKTNKASVKRHLLEYRNRHRKWYAANKEKRYITHLVKKFGFTKEGAVEVLKNNTIVCEICGRRESSKSNVGQLKRLTIDHCHKSGKVRGRLCDRCNRGIGFLQHNVFILVNAIQYLERYK